MSTATKQQKLVPELRFSGFSGGWSENKIGSIVKVERGGSPRPIQNYITSSSDGVPWIKIGDLKNGDRFVTKTAEKIKPEGVKNSREVFPGDFILSNSMSFGRPYIVNIYGCIHDGWLALRNEKQEKVINSFLYILLQSDATKKKFLSLAAGSAVKNLKSETVQLAKISYPNITEQQKIADFLGSVDAWLDNLRGQKTALQSYKQGMMQKLFTGQVRFKDEAGKSFPDWEKKELGELLSYKQPTEFIVESTEYKDEYKTPVLTAGKTFILGYTDETKGVYDYELPVIIFDDFTTATKFVDFKFKVKSSAMKILVPLDGHNAQFLFEAIQHIQFEVGGHGRQWISKYSRIPVSTPSAEEQSKIGDFILSVDKLVAAKEKEVAKVEEWKKGLMQKMFV